MVSGGAFAACHAQPPPLRAGKRFFEELDRDNDGRVKLEDLKICMRCARKRSRYMQPRRSRLSASTAHPRRRRKLPERYASEFMRRAKRGWFADSIGWEEFASLMHERESFTLKAYNSLQLNRSGQLALPAITSSLRRLGLPATDENAAAMLRYLGRAEDRYISYGEFRNFLLLLPPEQVRGTDPSVLWFEAATFVQLRAPAVAAGTSGVALLQAALAGALASGTSTAALHPLDTLKTRVQASVGRAPGFKALGRMIPELGPRRLYLGIIPAVTGTATSHAIRTASYEWARVALAPLLALGVPGLNDTAIQGIASGFGTFLGTGVRIPNEVLKQRLQTGQHAHVLEAARVVIRGGGVAALFAGTTATLAREVPFYVLGMVAYERLKAVARGISGKELTPWQTIFVGALSGAVAAVATTPADVLKTRIMTGRAPAGLGALGLAKRMVAEEGIASLYKGAAPRALWIAPLGAMNFAGYELAKKALNAMPEAAPTPAAEPVVATPVKESSRPRDLASAVSAAGTKAGTLLREAVTSLGGSDGAAAVREAGKAAASTVASTAAAAAPRIRQAAELIQKTTKQQRVATAAAPAALAGASAPQVVAAPAELEAPPAVAPEPATAAEPAAPAHAQAEAFAAAPLEQVLLSAESPPPADSTVGSLVDSAGSTDSGAQPAGGGGDESDSGSKPPAPPDE